MIEPNRDRDAEQKVLPAAMTQVFEEEEELDDPAGDPTKLPE